MLLEPSSDCIQSSQQLINHANKIIYLVRHSQTEIFCTSSLELFNLYKRFVENTIMQLGEDWRIESGLLAQEIMTQKSLTADEFCIFNEFMVGFLRKRLGQQGNQIHAQNNKYINEEEGQEEFLKYFNKSLQKSKEQTYSNDFSNNLTFKTLSLGFYITAGDIWTKTFKKYHQDIISEKFKSINLMQDKKLGYFATLDTVAQKWSVQSQNIIQSLLQPVENELQCQFQRNSQALSNAIKLGSVVVNISQTVIKQNSASELKIRVFSICTEFYLKMFLIWLIFSIKKSFNSSLFSSTCFVRYCDIIISSAIFKNDSLSSSPFHTIYKQFKALCDDEWKKLMKDYMMALNDDKEVLKTLIKRIGQKIEERFNKEIEDKRSKIL